MISQDDPHVVPACRTRRSEEVISAAGVIQVFDLEDARWSVVRDQTSAFAERLTSRGFEGLAINRSRDKLYTLLEGTVIGDPAKSLRINELDLRSESYTNALYLYALSELGTNIGDMTAINDHEFLVIERNGNTATTAGAPYKRIFLVDIAKVDANGYVAKTDLVDLIHPPALWVSTRWRARPTATEEPRSGLVIGEPLGPAFRCRSSTSITCGSARACESATPPFSPHW